MARAHQPPSPPGIAAWPPRCWLMTDARIAALLPAIAAALPPCSAIVIRPHALPATGRAALTARLRYIARARRHWLLLGGTGALTGFAGRHGSRGAHRRTPGRLLTLPVHDAREAARARRLDADAALISPVFPTRSHPGAATLGRAGFARLAAQAGRPAIALGGMDASRFARLRYQGAAGWAAIDAWGDRGR